MLAAMVMCQEASLGARNARSPSESVLSDSELSKRAQRVRMLCNLETISRQVAEAIAGLDKSIRIAMTKVV